MRMYLAIIAVLFLSACGSATLENHRGTAPKLKLEQFFNGELKAYGMVLDRSGNLKRRFEVDLLGNWQGNFGVLEEWFVFDDGEKSTRTWHLTKIGDSHYRGTASDVIGIAKGEVKGSALYWQYDMKIEVEGTEYEVTLSDWMFLMDQNRLFNKTELRKYGFKVGELILYIEKIPQDN